MPKRVRAIFDVTPEVQMAIRLRAIKNGITTGEVVAEAVRRVFGEDVEEARKVVESQEDGERG